MFLLNLDSDLRIPIIISPEDSPRKSRIGGTPPFGVYARKDKGVRYLLTLQLAQDPIVEISLFLLFEWDFLFGNQRRMFNQDDGLIEVVVHGASERDSSRSAEAILSPHALSYEKAEPDEMREDEDVFPSYREYYPSSGSKLGGHPYLIKSAPDLVDSIEALEDSGARQFIQLDFPGARDANIAGDWPFGDGMFHLFFSEKNDSAYWHYFWQN